MQQSIRSGTNLPEYNTIFRKHIIPINQPGHNYYNANNVNFVDKMCDVESNIIVIDSASRNWDKENSNNYTIQLGETFKYVHSIELVDGYVPASGYIINENNNVIHFQEKNEQTIIAIVDPGNYKIKSLLKSLSLTMTKASTNHYDYKCTIDISTKKVTISCHEHFNLIFSDGTDVIGDRDLIETLVINPTNHRKEIHKIETSDHRSKYIKNSIGKILGYKPLNLMGNTHYTGQFVFELLPIKYLALFLNTENSDDFKKIVAPCPNGANGAFAIVSLTNNIFDIHQYHQIVDNSCWIKTFNPPINFNKLKIQFRTIDGNLYDFNGIDHFLVFEIKKVFGRQIIKDLQNLT